MTDDSNLLRTTASVEAAGATVDEYGRWASATDGVLLPLYEGRLFSAFDFAAKAWRSGTGLQSKWDEVPWDRKVVRPQYTVPVKDLECHPLYKARPKLSFRNIARSTDTRTFIATVIVRDPTPHMTSNWFPANPSDTWALCAICDSFAFDFVARLRLGGTHLDWHLVSEFPLPPRTCAASLSRYALRLANPHQRYAPEWMAYWPVDSRLVPWRRLWAVTAAERLRLRAITDAAVGALFGLGESELRWVLRSCDHPIAAVNNKPFSRTLDTKGFWRVDKDLDPELRLPVLVQVAFQELSGAIQRAGGDGQRGVESFLSANGGDGWSLPETLRLADYGLGHDDRAKEPQPVAARLGPRFLPWQLEQSAEESWAECERHSRAILGDGEFERRRSGADVPLPSTAPGPAGGGARSRSVSPHQGALFSTDAFQLVNAPAARSKKAKK